MPPPPSSSDVALSGLHDGGGEPSPRITTTTHLESMTLFWSPAKLGFLGEAVLFAG